MKISYVISASLIGAMLLSGNIYGATNNTPVPVAVPEVTCSAGECETVPVSSSVTFIVPVCTPETCGTPAKNTNKNKPIIYAANKEIALGSKFDPMYGIKAIDENGISITKLIKVTGADKVNTNVPGKYNVTYSVIGNTGQTVSKTIKIKVLK